MLLIDVKGLFNNNFVEPNVLLTLMDVIVHYYFATGAIFPTKTKDMTGQIQGIENLKQVLALRPENKKQQIPVVAIGGINVDVQQKC